MRSPLIAPTSTGRGDTVIVSSFTTQTVGLFAVSPTTALTGTVKSPDSAPSALMSTSTDAVMPGSRFTSSGAGSE